MPPRWLRMLVSHPSDIPFGLQQTFNTTIFKRQIAQLITLSFIKYISMLMVEVQAVSHHVLHGTSLKNQAVHDMESSAD
ncbi:hypothetical protein OUZ56_009857 [Daphnia magna]|uniref:Uncharacterized protein n=1 Tax=Daphnia magna TaxID=35525 RepID=A0ABR0AH25_9CRUS|nr:hypothetical protein OUZ56_009857 [Daphnia magna]